ncbi:MAG: hypothetical protein WBZ36_22795 [Candidatus Nitrosopolaris sp.]
MKILAIKGQAIIVRSILTIAGQLPWLSYASPRIENSIVFLWMEHILKLWVIKCDENDPAGLKLYITVG